MALIDIGSPAINRAAALQPIYTYVAKANSANASGKITSIEIWCVTNMTGVEIAVFSMSGDVATTRDYQAISGTVVAGAKRTYSVDLDVEVGDYIGLTCDSGSGEKDNSGDGYWYISSDQIPCSGVTFIWSADRTISLYGTGVTVEEGNVIMMGCDF